MLTIFRIVHFFCFVSNWKGEVIPIGKGRIIRGAGGLIDTHSSSRGKERKDRVAILSIGTRLHEALVAAQEVEDEYPDLQVTVADARFMKPLDVDLVRQLADDHGVLITIEEGSIGGFGDHVLHFLALDGLLDEGNLKFRPMVMPDAYFEAGTQFQQYEQAGLNSRHIKGTILRLAKKIEIPILEDMEVDAGESTIAWEKSFVICGSKKLLNPKHTTTPTAQTPNCYNKSTLTTTTFSQTAKKKITTYEFGRELKIKKSEKPKLESNRIDFSSSSSMVVLYSFY